MQLSKPCGIVVVLVWVWQTGQSVKIDGLAIEMDCTQQNVLGVYKSITVHIFQKKNRHAAYIMH